ncbi:MAG: class I SAM-dependent methyltransferase [Candidatus Dormiibacterota bacterium]
MLPDSAMARRYPGINGRLHALDMLDSKSDAALRHYAATGEEALDHLSAALDAAGSAFNRVQHCLDLPCGYGRVLRWLVTRIDPSAITACDIDARAVRFCSREFGAQPLLSSRDFRAIRFPVPYDLVWVGSLLTHLEPASCLKLLDALDGAMVSHGVLVFTTHGVDCVDLLASYGREFSGLEASFQTSLAEHGTAFKSYAGAADFGITMHDAEALRRTIAVRLPQLRLIRFARRGWDGHQDVWAYTKEEVAEPAVSL